MKWDFLSSFGADYRMADLLGNGHEQDSLKQYTFLLHL